MRKIVLSLAVAGLLGACANNGESTSPQAGERSLPSSSTEAAAEKEKGGTMTKEDAARMAQTHLALKKTGWGEPTRVDEDAEKFYVVYDTPDRELRLIGQRTLLVDKETGVVTLQKRR